MFNRRTLGVLTLFLALAGGAAFAQTSASSASASHPLAASQSGKGQLYGLGDQMFLVNAGLFVPLFFQSESGTISNTNLSLGGMGSLEFDVFLNNNLAVGAEFGGTFSFSPNGHALFLIPITGKVSWIFHLYPFDIPIFLGAGVDLMRLNNQFYVGPILKPGAAGYYNITSKWSIGLRATYWWVPEVYFGPTPPASRSRFGNFLELSLSGLYHF